MADRETVWVTDDRFPNRRVEMQKITPGVCWHCGVDYKEINAMRRRIKELEEKLVQGAGCDPA